ncbi:MAG: OmpA family protein, partial [Proteobacteria bacterium]|nr:OmpA family protein [Pseudomonadota bacterium]
YESSTELSDQVASDPGGIGFIGLPYVRNAVALGVAESPQTPAIVPTEFTISTEDYPLSRRLYFYVPATTSSRTIRDFVQFTLSDAGQAVVEKTGLISQRIRAEPARIRAGTPPRFEQVTANAQRLSVSLRFDAVSDRLDNKGVQDIDRIVAFMKENRQRELMLLGFTDDSGNPAADLELSRSRARILAQMFIARGLYPAVADGFGAALPVASNDSDAGRRKNRRVEVWIR